MTGAGVTFDEFVSEQGQPLLRLAFVLTGDRHLSEDLTQTALANAFRHWHKVQKAHSPEAYVRRMLVNAQLDWYRRRSSSESPREMSEQANEWVADPTEAIAARDQMRGLLDGLAPRARTVLVLRYYADLDDAAIADTMGIGVSAVRATASRALGTLREQPRRDVMEENR